MKNGYTSGGIAHVKGDARHPDLCGWVTFLPRCGGTLVVAEISGLPASETGFFGFHIHEGNGCCGQGFSETGGHYDPHGMPHPRHAGDLPPLLSCGGKAFQSVLTGRFRVGEIIGRTVVIHSQADDFRTQPSGDAGEKIACGVIQKACLEV